MKKQWISLLLIISILMSLCVPVFADDPEAAPEPTYEVTGGTVVNPLFADIPLPEASFDGGIGIQSVEGIESETREATYVSPETAADQLRQAMVNRESGVDLHVNVSNYWSTSASDNYVAAELFPMAYSQALSKCPYDGDYLHWSWAGYDWQLVSTNGTQYDFHLNLRYYTTQAEEKALQARVTALQSELGLSGKSAYDAYAAIYDYITGHVAYDNDGLDTFHDSISGNENYYIYTAYAAELNGKAVCQGYATLFYALCWQAGLPVRIVYSSNHAWNIVKLDGVWYNVDATWDADTSSGRKWFLLGSTNFDGGMHTAASEFKTAAFTSSYPISTTDYDPSAAPDDDAGGDPEPAVETPYYTDVPADRWSYASIQRATDLGLFNGIGDGLFAPTMNMSRAMLVTVLYRLEGTPSGSPSSGFKDVSSGSYYAKAVDWAAANNIVYGIGNNLFDPDGNATREQAVTILHRYAKFRGLNVSASDSLRGYSDLSQVSSFAVTPMQWAVGAKIVTGTSTTTLSPQGTTTREQMAALLVRLIDYYGLK